MPTSHTVRLGDCMGSLAKFYGFADYRTLYDDGANATLKGQRPNANELVEGDVVSVPDRAKKEIGFAAGSTRKFKLKAPPTLLRIVVQDEQGTAFGDRKYKLTVGAQVFEGKTPADGKLEHPIAADATAATLELWLKDEPGIDGYWFTLELGALEHESKDRACQARLMNLGFDCGSLSGALDDRTKDALRGFQKKHGLTANGTFDAPTRNKLRQEHEGA